MSRIELPCAVSLLRLPAVPFVERLSVIEDAEKLGFLRPHTGSRIFEGTVGSTGISIATIARAR